MFKYLSVLIIGFSAGFFVNLVSLVNMDDNWRNEEQLPHVVRRNHLQKFYNQQRDEYWATRTEFAYKTEFSLDEEHTLHDVKCFSDVCVLDYTYKKIEDNPYSAWPKIYEVYDAVLSSKITKKVPAEFQHFSTVVLHKRS